jgi:hypothetical protein
MVRGYNSKKIFENQMKILPKNLKRRIKYFRIYLKTNKINLYPIYSKTDKDGERCENEYVHIFSAFKDIVVRIYMCVYIWTKIDINIDTHTYTCIYSCIQKMYEFMHN